MIIFVRHGDDDEKKPKYAHDHRMTKRGGKDVKRFIKFFLKEYGQPHIIYCSPFRRATDTLYAMTKYLGQETKIVIDPDLSRYFTGSEKDDPQVYKATLKYGPPIMEKRKKFHKRTKNFFKRMMDSGYAKEDKLVMVITHALVLKDCAKFTNVKLPEHYDFLEHFAIRENKNGELERVDGRREESKS